MNEVGFTDRHPGGTEQVFSALMGCEKPVKVEPIQTTVEFRLSLTPKQAHARSTTTCTGCNASVDSPAAGGARSTPICSAYTTRWSRLGSMAPAEKRDYLLFHKRRLA